MNLIWWICIGYSVLCTIAIFINEYYRKISFKKLWEEVGKYAIKQTKCLELVDVKHCKILVNYLALIGGLLLIALICLFFWIIAPIGVTLLIVRGYEYEEEPYSDSASSIPDNMHYSRRYKILVNDLKRPETDRKPLRLKYFGKNKIIKENHSEVIFLEASFDKELNDFFVRNYDEVNKIFAQRMSEETHTPFRFVYFPITLSAEMLSKTGSYIRPDVEINFTDEQIKTVCNELYAKLISGAEQNQRFEFTNGLIHITNNNVRDYDTGTFGDEYSYVKLEYKNDEQMFADLQYYVEHLSETYHYFACHERYSEEYDADERFSLEIRNITSEIKAKIAELQAYGVSEYFIKKMIFEPPKISRMQITTDFRILLPDYGKEIKLTPLQKTVYFFFLRHHEGVLFKCLVDYKNELREIYMNLTNRENEKKIKTSIDDLVDYTKNSINEKCSRIREAFLTEFTEELATNYTVTTGEANVKHIILDRSLIDDESGIVIRKE